jgi:hypothetical protein
MSIHRPLAGLVALSLLVVACSSAAPAGSASPSASAAAAATASPSASASASPSAKPTPTPSPTPTPVPSPVTLTLSGHVWWGGYVIDVTGATYDPLKRKLNISATFLNTSTADNDVSGLGAKLNVVWNSTYISGYIPVGAVPAGGTVKADIQVTAPVGFVPADAVLTFGQPTDHQATVPLNGSPAASDQPTTLSVTGAVKMGTAVKYTVTKATLMPASCSGTTAKIKFGAIKKDEMSIILFGTTTNTATTDGSIDLGFLDVPDGTSAAAVPAIYLYLGAKQTMRDVGLCFAVPAPGSGTYKLSLHESRSKATGTLSFQVP